jgi:hypothetical protein
MLGQAAAALERIQNIVRRVVPGAGPAERCASASDLAALLAREAAFVAQKATVEFCRARAGCNWAKLFDEQEFVREMARSRWSAFPVLLADLAELAQTLLRRAGAAAAARPEALAPVVRAALRHHGEPEIPLDLERIEAEIDTRLRVALEAEPRPAHGLGRASGRQVFEALPLRTDLRADREMVENNVRFLLCGAYARLEERVDVPALAAALAAGSPAPP